MDVIDKITSAFIRFPGIGPRQAKRFVAFLLSADPRFAEELAGLIRELRSATIQCGACGRHFVKKREGVVLCKICADETRAKDQLMVVEKDIDIDHIDRSGAYRGGFFVLGGTLPVLEKNPEERIRIRALQKLLDERGPKKELKEIILALSTNVEGEETAAYLQRTLAAAAAKWGVAITLLGRGLSSGAEIEYADMETLKNALKHREPGNP